MSNLVELRRLNRLIEAEIARTFLESHGVGAVVFDSGLNIMDGGGLATAVRLMVMDEDVEIARQLLETQAEP